MKKCFYLLVALTVLWTWQAGVNSASGHGGTYRGPAGEVPPGQRDPTDPQPPPDPTPSTDPGNTGGPGTGNDDGPPSPGERPPSGSPRPTPPVASGPVGLPPTNGTSTPRGNSRPPVMSFENWIFWWSYNKDEILNLKAALGARDRRTSTKSSHAFFGPAGDTNRKETQAPTRARIRAEVVPALLAAVSNEDLHPDIRGGALIALARCGEGTTHLKVIMDLARPEAGEDKLVMESALLALGIMKQPIPEVRDFLISVIDDVKAPSRARCFAELSLGLLGFDEPEVYACLERRLDGREATQDVPVCAILAMGLIGDTGKVDDLVKWLTEGRVGRYKLNDIEKSYVVSALGKIGHPDALKPIIATLNKRGMYAKRSAMIAFGQILPQASSETQMEYVKKIAAALRSEKDGTARNFAIISLGRIGGADGADDAVRSACERVLTDEFENGSKTTVRPFAALGLGLLCFEGTGDTAKSGEMKYRVAGMIRKELARMKGDKVALGAQAIALGMIGDRSKETTDLLVKILGDRGLEKRLRGSAATALGLIRSPEAKTAVLRALEEREDRDLRVDTAVAAGLLGDGKAVEILVKVVNDRKSSQFVLGSVALALGQIGDGSAVGPLVRMLEPEKVDGVYPDLTRALVAVALGQLADLSDIRVLYRLSKDVNYRASVAALDEVLTIL